MSFIEELKRRKVIRVGIAYLIGAWLLLQLSDVLSELLSLPDEFGPVVVGLVAIGFPIALLMSWVFEFTTEGLKRESDIRPGERSSGLLLNVLMVGMLVVALGYFIWESRFSGNTPAQPSAETTTLVEAPSGASVDVNETPSIAVLPFENFSGNAEDDYFADGLADTLTHQLAQIPGLKVIARNSSFQFKGSNKDVREIGRELGVSTLLEGSVQRSGDQVRIILQLVNTRDSVQLWSDIFEGGMDNIFEVQDQVASSLLAQLETGLSRLEIERLMRAGTDQPQAYDLLLKATNTAWDVEQMMASGDQGDEAIGLIKQALELDPDYAEAWVGLARRYSSLAFVTGSTADRQRFIDESSVAAKRAIELAPDYYGGYMAMGWVHNRNGNRSAAVTQFRHALQLFPNDVNSLSGLGLQLMNADPEEALALFTRSLELEPTNTIAYRQKHFALLRLGRANEALEQIERGIEENPSFGILYADLVERYQEDLGRPDLAARRISEHLLINPGSPIGHWGMSVSWQMAGEYQRSIDWLEDQTDSTDWTDRTIRNYVRALLALGRYQAALDWLDKQTPSSESSAASDTLFTSVCLALQKMECATSTLKTQRARLQQQRESGDFTPEQALISDVQALLLSELQTREAASSFSTPFIEDAAQPEQYLFFRMGGEAAWYLFAGLAARRGDLPLAIDYLERTLPEDELSLFSRDPLGFDVERSLLLKPIRNEPEFISWLERYRARREAVQQSLQAMETRGEIAVPPTSPERTAP